MPRALVDLEAESVEQLLAQAYEHAYASGWTDGCPIIPPTAQSVARFVRAAGRAGDEIIGVLPPRKGQATVEIIAANAVMAGCLPEYHAVIIAAVEAISDPRFPLELMQLTTNPMGPMLVVNGPIRRELDINYGTGCMGPGWRANATIGRALRLILVNIGGALPGVYSKCSFGSPLRYSFVFGENEEENPWSPYHVDRGFAREDSTVTVFRAANYCNISGGEGVGPDEIIRHISSSMPPMFGGGDGAMVILGVNHAQALHEAGVTKRDIQQKLWEYARFSVSHFAKTFVEQERQAGRGDATTLWRTRVPEENYVLVAGGPGPQDVYVAAGMPQTRLIQRPA